MSRLVDRGRCRCAAVAPVDRHHIGLAGGVVPGLGSVKVPVIVMDSSTLTIVGDAVSVGSFVGAA